MTLTNDCDCRRGRKKLVIAEVSKADIAVLVECTEDQLRDILLETDKFEGHIVLKINEKDGTAILFNKSRFSFMEKDAQRLSNEGGQIVLNVVLFDHQTQKLLCVTGLHLKSGDELFNEMRRVREIKSALKITDEFLKKKYGQIPQVISGDLNSDLYRYKTVTNVFTYNGYINVGHRDVSSLANEKPTYFFHQPSIYDYIFIKGDIKANSYNVDHLTGKCPNANQGSDHLAIRCNLIL